MNWEREVIDRIKAYNFILLDANFISHSDHDVVWKLYDLNSISELDSLEEDIINLNEDLQWKLEDIVKDDRVFTIPGVVDEVSEFKNIFLDSYKWYKRDIRFAQRRRPFRRNIRSERRSHKKRITESLIERTLKDIRENEINPYNNNKLYHLNSVVRTLEKVINHLKIYQGPIKELSMRVENASETDHLLVKAAFGCFLENQERKIAIISSDYHIEQISYINSVYCCFDIITPLTTVTQKFETKTIQPYIHTNV